MVDAVSGTMAGSEQGSALASSVVAEIREVVSAAVATGGLLQRTRNIGSEGSQAAAPGTAALGGGCLVKDSISRATFM